MRFSMRARVDPSSVLSNVLYWHLAKRRFTLNVRAFFFREKKLHFHRSHVIDDAIDYIGRQVVLNVLDAIQFGNDPTIHTD